MLLRHFRKKVGEERILDPSFPYDKNPVYSCILKHLHLWDVRIHSTILHSRAAGELLADWVPPHHPRPAIYRSRPGHQHRQAQKYVQRQRHDNRPSIHIHNGNHQAGEQSSSAPQPSTQTIPSEQDYNVPPNIDTDKTGYDEYQKQIASPKRNTIFKDQQIVSRDQIKSPVRGGGRKRSNSRLDSRKMDKIQEPSSYKDSARRSYSQETIHPQRSAPRPIANLYVTPTPVLLAPSMIPGEVVSKSPMRTIGEIEHHVAATLTERPASISSLSSPGNPRTSLKPTLSEVQKSQSYAEHDLTGKEHRYSANHYSYYHRKFGYKTSDDSNHIPKLRPTESPEAVDVPRRAHIKDTSTEAADDVYWNATSTTNTTESSVASANVLERNIGLVVCTLIFSVHP